MTSSKTDVKIKIDIIPWYVRQTVFGVCSLEV